MFCRHFLNLRPKKQERQKLTLDWIIWTASFKDSKELQGLASPQAYFQAMEAVNSALNACCVLISSVALYPG